MTGLGAHDLRLQLLGWMRRQDFARLTAELLPEVEALVVDEHAALHRDLLGEAWSPPRAYRWIRYESPDPVGQLVQASERLAGDWERARDHPGWATVRSAFEELERRRLERALLIAKGLGYAGRGDAAGLGTPA